MKWSELYSIQYLFECECHSCERARTWAKWEKKKTRSTSTFQRGDKMRTRFWNRNTYALRAQNQLRRTTPPCGCRQATTKWFFAGSISVICQNSCEFERPFAVFIFNGPQTIRKAKQNRQHIFVCIGHWRRWHPPSTSVQQSAWNLWWHDR